jgi:hypothetical protein
MIAFEISVNGQRKFTAGSESQTLITGLNRIRTAPGEACLLFSTCAIEPEPLKIEHWPDCDIKVGDTIEVRIIETSSADQPDHVDTPAPESPAQNADG